MKKNKIGFLALAAVTFFGLVGTAFNTISWFVASVVTPQYKVNGSSAGAYFAYGDGSENHPYGISIPRHLYNLSWLQYMGQFSDGQYYFELADSVPSDGLNMNGYILPPIGTEDNPFVGNFNGNGKIIKNLTVTNDESTIFNSSRHPDPTQVEYTTPEIVGLFGVVGNLGGAYTGTYDSAANTVYNLGLSNIDVQAKNSKALAGIVAGYVDAPVTSVAVSDGSVSINQSGTAKVDGIGTDNLSDYTIIGYCTDSYKANVTQASNSIYGIDVQNNEFVVQDEGTSSGLGGSINMTDLYNRILKAKGTTTSNSLVRQTVAYDTDKTTVLSTTNQVYSTTGNSRGAWINNSTDKIGTYNVGYYSNTNYMCLIGGHYETATYKKWYTHTGRYITDGTNYLTYDGSSLGNTTNQADANLWTFTNNTTYYYISTTYNGTTYYLYYNSGALGIVNSTGNTRRWVVDDSGTKRDIKYYGDQNYHLTYNSGWTLVNTSGSPYYLIHDGNGHYMGPTSSYVTTNVDATSAVHFYYSTSAHGYYNSTSTSYYLGYYSDSYPVQLYSDDNSYYRLVDSNGNLQNTLYGTGYLRNFNKNADTTYSTTRYVKWNNNAWTYSTNVSGATQITITYIDPTSFTASLNKSADESSPKNGPDFSNENYTEKTGMVYSASDTSYFPLNVLNDGTQSDLSNYKPKDTNTGYIVGGSRESLMSTGTSSLDLSDASSTRVSKYAISNISFSYSSKTLNHVYTINASNQIQEIGTGTGYYTGYQEYSKAKTKMKTILDKDASYVYGLHYVEATVSKKNLVVPSYALVNGHEYYTADKYELPVNTIDFNLKEQGYINFFAGMYYPGNDAMFSLHQIRRNADNTIAEIKEIAEVLSDNNVLHSYVYKFTDGQYSVPFITQTNGTKTTLSGGAYDEATSLSGGTTAPTGYSTVFSTSRITNYNGSTRINGDFHWPGRNGVAGQNSNTDKTVQDTRGQNLTLNKSIFYFEIPMNIGEFALGSTTYGYGGYLFYLDIGANARKLNRTTFIEKFTHSTESFEYPLGVAFVADLASSLNEGVFVIDATDSGYVTILASYNDTLEVSREGNTITYDGYDSTYNKGEYKKNTITLQNGSDPPNAIAVVPKTTTDTIWRMQYYDYNTAKHEMIRTVITRTTTSENGGEAQTSTVVQQYNTSGTLVYDNTDENLNSTEDITIYNNSGGAVNSASWTSIAITPATNANDTTIMTYTYSGTTPVIDDIIYELVATQINDSTYYHATGYTVTIEVSSGSITITTTPYSGSDASYSGMTVTVNGYEITIANIDVKYVAPQNP